MYTGIENHYKCQEQVQNPANVSTKNGFGLGSFDLTTNIV